LTKIEIRPSILFKVFAAFGIIALFLILFHEKE
jgi:hypothetical protein